MARPLTIPPNDPLPRADEHAGDHPADDVPAEIPDLPQIPVENFLDSISAEAGEHLPDFFDIV